jgi:ABC-type uncharacterized transport system substrate-binding protein
MLVSPLSGKSSFLQVILVVLGSMHAAQAEQTSYRIGLVSPGSASSMAPRVEALKNGLRDHGYVEGQNITIEYRWGDGRTNGFRSSCRT